jgi:hypothetical protein
MPPTETYASQRSNRTSKLWGDHRLLTLINRCFVASIDIFARENAAIDLHRAQRKRRGKHPRR